jgi:hypothetical protein
MTNQKFIALFSFSPSPDMNVNSCAKVAKLSVRSMPLGDDDWVPQYCRYMVGDS